MKREANTVQGYRETQSGEKVKEAEIETAMMQIGRGNGGNMDSGITKFSMPLHSVFVRRQSVVNPCTH